MIEFVIPWEFLPRVVSGELVRYGAVLKDAVTGRIVGHLKEVGNFSQLLGNPLTDGISVVSNIVQNFQLRSIGKTLESLQLINNIGAVASLATLGVSVVGFAVVTSKLNKIDEKLDVVLEKLEVIKEILENLQMKQEVLEFAEVETASQQLHKALFTMDEHLRFSLLMEANKTFHKYKNYYLKIAQNHNLWEDGKLPLTVAHELYSRYMTCVMGQLYSEFLLGDISSYRESWKLINKEVQGISKFDKLKVLRVRSDSNMYTIDYEPLLNEIQNTSAILIETSRRIETMDTEAKYLQDNNIKPFDYLKELREMEDGIIMIPAS